jgi:Uma2 family endonuclease
MAGTALESGESRVVLHDVSWELYEQLLKQLEEQHVHLTYDNGELELMSPLPRHEHFKVVISRWVFVLTEELSLNFKQLGSMTFRRQDLAKGLEPDDCFWLENEPAVRDKLDFDPLKDPPPDLALEIDITSSSLDREGIYAALGIRELWRYDGKTFRAFQLNRQKKYVRKTKSLNFPNLPLDEFQAFFHRPKGITEGEWTLRFRSWVRKKVKH